MAGGIVGTGPSCTLGPSFCPLVGFSQLQPYMAPVKTSVERQVLELSFFQSLPCGNLDVKLRGRCSNQRDGSFATQSLMLILRRLPFSQRECAL